MLGHSVEVFGSNIKKTIVAQGKHYSAGKTAVVSFLFNFFISVNVAISTYWQSFSSRRRMKKIYEGPSAGDLKHTKRTEEGNCRYWKKFDEFRGSRVLLIVSIYCH